MGGRREARGNKKRRSLGALRGNLVKGVCRERGNNVGAGGERDRGGGKVLNGGKEGLS